jgi:type IV secretion system protein VirB11
MGSSASSTADGRRPGRDTALRQLLRPLEPYLERREVTELAVNRPGEIWIRSPAGWARQDTPELTAQYLEALTTAMAVHSGLGVRSLASVILPGGERGQIVRAPACVDGMAPITIRSSSWRARSRPHAT